MGPFVGSTSNQADAYLELLLPHRADLLQESFILARQINGEYNDVSFEELAFEIAASDPLHIPQDPAENGNVDGQPVASYCTTCQGDYLCHEQPIIDLDL